MKFSEKEIFVGLILFVILIAFIVKLFWVDFGITQYCGDGICSDSESGYCKIDCNWCGDGYCNSNECEIGCVQDCSLSQCENRVCEPEKGENCMNTPNDCTCDGGYCNADTMECDYETCGNDICDAGENFVNCPNDCEGIEYIEEDLSDVNYPIIFVHGHSMKDEDSGISINAFREFQEKLEEDGYTINEGIVLPKGLNLQSGIWSRFDKPISVRTTYYLDAYDVYGSSVGREDNQHISVYAERLGGVVDEVLDATGKNKVIIIAHSMGGLVSREYIKEYAGDDKVDKLITIGTPNHGIYGLVIGGLCESWFSRSEYSPECDDMQNNSSFMEVLNSNDETYGDLEYYTIAGSCDYNGEDYHDEVVRVSSVHLNGAISNEIIYGECVPWLGTFHSYLISPSEVPEVYGYVVDFLDF